MFINIYKMALAYSIKWLLFISGRTASECPKYLEAYLFIFQWNVCADVPLFSQLPKLWKTTYCFFFQNQHHNTRFFYFNFKQCSQLADFPLNVSAQFSITSVPICFMSNDQDYTLILLSLYLNVAPNNMRSNRPCASRLPLPYRSQLRPD